MLPNGVTRGHNSKLETFLKKKLKPGVYGDIRWYEPVVVRRESSLSYKQVVVTGEEILLTDTPPKEITTLLNINTITAVLMVHDLPEFLEGGLRDRTTHILLKVRTEASMMRNLKEKMRTSSISSSKASSSRRGSLQSLVLDEVSTQILPKDRRRSVTPENFPNTNGNAPSWKKLRERRYSDILSYTNLDKHNLLKTSSRSRPPLLRGSPVNEDHEEMPSRSPSFPRGSLAPHDGRRSLGDSSYSEQEEEEEGLSPLLGIKKDFMMRPISPALCEVLNRVDTKNSHCLEQSKTPDHAVLRQKLPRSISAMENYEGPTVPATVRSRSVLDKPLNLYSYSSTCPKRESIVSSVNSVEFAYDEDEVHLYTLSTSSHLFHLLHSLWMASLMVSYSDVTADGPSNSDAQLNEEGIDQTFRSLRSDIKEALSAENHSYLLQDLLQGIRKYSIVRRMFWKDSETLSLVRRLMRSYCHPKPNEISPSGEDVIEKRENELRVLILGLEVVEASLLRSQGCPFKGKTLTNSKSPLQELLREVFSIPDIPSPHNLMCKRFLTNFRELSEGVWHSLPEKELIQLVQDLIHMSVAAAFCLFEAIFEIGWSDECQKTTTSKIANKNNDVPSLRVLLKHVALDKWLTYAMPQLLLLVQLKPRDIEGIMAREDIILTYQFFAVLLTLLKQSPKALSFCIANYSEELRYYVNESVLKRKFDALDPLTPHSFRLAKSISKLVLR